MLRVAVSWLVARGSWRAAGPGSSGRAPGLSVVEGDNGIQRWCRSATLAIPSGCSADSRDRCRALCLVEAGERRRTKDSRAMASQSRVERQARLGSGSGDLLMTIREDTADDLPSTRSGEVNE